MSYDTILCAISSRDFSSGSGTGGLASFDVLPNTLTEIIEFRVKDVSVPKTFFNVETFSATATKKWGIRLYFIGNATGAFTVDIREGSYTLTELMAEIDARILAATGNTTVTTEDSRTQRLVITRTAGPDATLQVDIAAAGANVYGLNRLGFTTTAALAAAITADTSYVLVLPQSFLLQSQVLGSYKNMATGLRTNITTGGINKSNVIYRIYLNTVNSNDFMTAVIPSDWYKVQINGVSQIDLSLTDDEGFDVNLQAQTWSCTLEFHVRKGN